MGKRIKPKTNGTLMIGVWTIIWPSFGLPEPEREYRFDAHRHWRFDYAWPAYKVALEVEGGVWTGGRHTSGAGFLKDMDKYNAAAIQGWKVLRVTPKDLFNKGPSLLREAIPVSELACVAPAIKRMDKNGDRDE